MKQPKVIPSKGLLNLGNTCFFNSVMQCVLSLDKFVRFFEKTQFGEKQPISRAVQNFIKQYRETRESVVDPSTFIHNISSEIRLFNGTQQDAHAFLEWMLSKVFTENQKDKDKPSEIEKMFSMEHKNTITCKECLHKEERVSLSCIQWLFIHNTVEESINAYEGIEDIVDNSAQWTCSNCKEKVVTGIKHKITKCSNYVILHLNRFLDVKNKNTNRIFIDEMVEIAGETYKICGIVCHSGSLNFGHYFAYAQRNGEKTGNKFNDTAVSKGSLQMDSSGPYILFYERCDGKPQSLRSKL